jgi:8-oxo-dGTP pyrophosphatase MutT (NUDIX family)
MRINVIRQLSKELKKPLPGKKAHVKMMPEGRLLMDSPQIKKNAAVVILIFQSNKGQEEIVFIKRNEYEGHHSGQVSFPGGKEDKEDQSLEYTAIRECLEEIGVELSLNELIGHLTPLYVMVSEVMIYPYVFYLPKEPEFITDKSEVNYLIRYPFDKLTDKSIKKEKIMAFQGIDYCVPYYSINSEVVWGATAMILAELIDVIENIK